MPKGAATAILEELPTMESNTSNKILEDMFTQKVLAQKLHMDLCSFIHMLLCTSQSTFLDMLPYTSASIQLLYFLAE